MTHSLSLVLLLAFAELPALAHSIVIAVRPKTRTERPDLAQALGGLIQQVVLLGILAVTWREGWWSRASVGIEGGLAMLGAPIAAMGVWWAVSRLWRPPVDIPAMVEGQRGLWPRSKAGRGLVVATLAINPVTEELVCRGVFVYQVHQATGSVVLGVALGLVVNVVMHLYQGRGPLGWHVLFYAATVGLLYSPVGLLGSIALHLLADLAPAVPPNAALAWIRYSRSQRGVAAVEAPVDRPSSTPNLRRKIVQAGPAILWGAVAVGALVALPENPHPAVLLGLVVSGAVAIGSLLPLLRR